MKVSCECVGRERSVFDNEAVVCLDYAASTVDTRNTEYGTLVEEHCPGKLQRMCACVRMYICVYVCVSVCV
jgi:hypothetical protein